MKCPTCQHELPSEGIFIDEGIGAVIVDGVAGHHMGYTLLDFARYMLQNLGATLAKEKIHNGVYGLRLDGGPDIKSIDVMICHLRKALAPTSLVIETVWGRGYRLVRDRGAAAVPFTQHPDMPARLHRRSTYEPYRMPVGSPTKVRRVIE